MIERRIDNHAINDPIPGRLAYGVTILVALATLTPYVWIVPEKNMQLVIQAQTTLFSGWLMILAFYYKARNDAVKDQTIAAQAETAKTAGAALATAATANTPGAVSLQPGDSVKVAAVDGTTP